jgi:oxidase EvaA
MAPPSRYPDDIREWVEAVRRRDRLQVEPLALGDSRMWRFGSDGAIVHATGRFFRIVGVTWDHRGRRNAQPFIEQREIGTLGFLARKGAGGLDLLVQAKSEPGNVGGVQLAPTCQATASNSARVHGGLPPPFSDRFLSIIGPVLSDSLQSEQGSRFLGKCNRNIMYVVDDAPEEDIQHRWMPFEHVARLLAEDFTVNTDARSVISTTNWERLLDRSLFTGRDAFTRLLHTSFYSAVREGAESEVQRFLALGGNDSPVAVTPLEAMEGWIVDRNGAMPVSNGNLSVRQIAVHAETREVVDWDQPIVDDHFEQTATLDCEVVDGLLRFGFRAEWEPGLVAGVELGPSSLAPTAEAPRRDDVFLSARMSDEGGRFYRNVVTYRIARSSPQEDDMIWLTLAEMNALLPLGYFNNEARSAISLLLSRA